MKRYEYIDGVKTDKYPILNLYIERINESWQAKVFGITMPLFFICTIALLIIFPVDKFSLLALILQGTISLWFIISYGLLINRQIRDKEDELKKAIWRDCKNR